MKAIWITRFGGPEVLAVREGPDPEPGPGQVRVRVRAAGLNFAEIMARLGLYPDAPKPPCVVGYEAAGVVDAVGRGVSAPAPGTNVLALTRFGAQAEALCLPAAQAVPMPEGMTFEEGAALPVNYLTAYHALFRVAALRPGETVLVHMAAGGVGIAALQLCRTVPDVVTFGTASASKHAAIRAEGCDFPIDYHTVDYAREVRHLTKGKGVDVVLDPLGGNDWRKGYRLLRPAGRLIAYGFANLATGERRSVWKSARVAVGVPIFTPIGLMNDNRAVAGVNMGHLWNEMDMLTAELKALLELHGKRAVRPHVDSVFRFEQAGEAHRRIQSRQNVGKVVLVP
jgi:NADPH:quinone reductase-like Zn-dependent oxidoreductase